MDEPKLGMAIGFDAVRSRVDENGVTVIEEARLSEVSIVSYKPGDERYGVYPIHRAVEPVDAGLDLPPLPIGYKPTDAELQKAVNSWDANMGTKAGLLDAEVVDE